MLEHKDDFHGSDLMRIEELYGIAQGATSMEWEGGQEMRGDGVRSSFDRQLILHVGSISGTAVAGQVHRPHTDSLLLHAQAVEFLD